jgi:tetrahydromethanopterin S-methyltransferase subunit B
MVTAFVRKTIATLFKNPTWGLVIAVVIALIANLSTIQYIISLQNNLETMFNTDLIGQNYIQSARIKLLSINKDINNLFLLIDLDEKYVATDRILTHKREVAELLAKSKPFYRAKKSSQLVAEAGKLFAECAITIDSLIGLSKSGATGEALGIITGEMKNKFETLDDRLNYLDGLKQRHDIKVFKNIDYQLSISIIFTVIALVITIGVKLFVYRKKRRSIGKEPLKTSP